MVPNEFGHDFPSERLEFFIVAVFLRIEHLRCQDFLYGLHRADQLAPFAFGESPEHAADLLNGARLPRSKLLTAFTSEREQDLAPVVFRRRLLDKPALLEGAEDAAEISGGELKAIATTVALSLSR